MNTFNAQADMDIPDDEDEFGDVEGRPLVGWFLMAVALVAMAFLIGSGPEASAHSVRPAVAAQATVSTQANLLVTNRAAIDLSFGG